MDYCDVEEHISSLFQVHVVFETAKKKKKKSRKKIRNPEFVIVLQFCIKKITKQINEKIEKKR